MRSICIWEGEKGCKPNIISKLKCPGQTSKCLKKIQSTGTTAKTVIDRILFLSEQFCTHSHRTLASGLTVQLLTDKLQLGTFLLYICVNKLAKLYSKCFSHLVNFHWFIYSQRFGWIIDGIWRSCMSFFLVFWCMTYLCVFVCALPSVYV